VKTRKSRQRQLVDSSDRFYKEQALNICESHQQQLVDCSDPFCSPYTQRLPRSPRSWILTLTRRKDLNNPPTAVGGIRRYLERAVCRKDLNDPPTAVGGIRRCVKPVLGSASKLAKVFGLPFILALLPMTSLATPYADSISVSVSRSRAQPGDTVEIKVLHLEGDPVRAVLLTPTVGSQSLSLTPVASQAGAYFAELVLPRDAPQGLYVVHAWTGDSQQPTAVGKASFLTGRLVGDFFIPAYLDPKRTRADFENYLKEFRSLGGNFLVAHNLITPTKAYYPSKIARTDVTAGSPNDLVELTLSEADKQGLATLLSISWDMTKQSPFKDRMKEIKAISAELFSLYKHHPSLAGFYSYQEGSGTYYVPFVREFSQHIKSLNPNLLTACAPHIDDPLLAGYLGTVEELDIIMYQAGVMASYRTDNRKMYPFRRVKDFCALGSGAKRLQNKISINHVELFGYLENRLTPDTTATSYNNIRQQILSAATVTGADGISFFTYQAHVYETAKKLTQVERSRAAVAEGVKAFDLIRETVSNQPNFFAVYFPYSDWIIERWPNFFLPALDGFRVLGEPVDVLPYAPPIAESVYPYYPFHANEDVLARLLREKVALVLPNVSGFQQTDSDLIKAFVDQGGVVIAFGPQIPMGRSYDRTELFGIEESSVSKSHDSITVESPLGPRAKREDRMAVSLEPSVVWTPKGARVIATFEDASPAVTVNKFGKGTTIAIMPNTSSAARSMPQLTRDVLDYARSVRGVAALVDIVGSKENTDMAVTQTRQGFRVAFVNHGNRELPIEFKPVNPGTSKSAWIDLTTGESIKTMGASLELSIPPNGFRVIEFRRAQ